MKLKYDKKEIQLALPRKNISNSPEKIKEMFGENIVSAYKFINHNCDSSHLKDLGNLKSGNKLWVNPFISNVDFIITTGVIVPHCVAGFSVGIKSILPGINGRRTIEGNHSNMVHPNARAGNLKSNPLHEEM